MKKVEWTETQTITKVEYRSDDNEFFSSSPRAVQEYEEKQAADKIINKYVCAKFFADDFDTMGFVNEKFIGLIFKVEDLMEYLELTKALRARYNAYNTCARDFYLMKKPVYGEKFRFVFSLDTGDDPDDSPFLRCYVLDELLKVLDNRVELIKATAEHLRQVTNTEEHNETRRDD